MTTHTLLLATGLECTPFLAICAAVQQSFVFTAYGHHQASPLPSSLGYNGVRFEALTGHYLLGNGYRAYNPILMRFNSPDNLSPFGRGGINAYGYCGGDPVNRVDPSGHVRLPKLLNGPQRVVRMAPPIGREVEFDLSGGVATTLVSRFYPDAEQTRIFREGFMFQDKGGTRTTLVAHGRPGLVTLDGKPRSGSLLVDDLRAAGGITAQTKDLRILACRSAELEASALAATVARQSGLPTKGYRGRPRASLDEVMAFSRSNPGQEALDNFVRGNFIVAKRIRSAASRTNVDHPYDDWRPEQVTFRP